MTTHIQESRSIAWIFVPVFLALLISAWVGLQLFQDGSSYLQEMLIVGSAVRHGRISILLFQSPTIFLIKMFHLWAIDSLITLPFVRLAFNLNYALVPFFSLLFSWLVVRKKREELFIWAALIILFVNLVNFSWVSELLISVQFSCPLLLALLQSPKSKIFWSLSLFLVPFIFFLHPLVLTIYLILAAASAYVAYRQPVHRRAASLSMILFLLAAAARGVYSLFTLNPYEMSFAASGDIDDYFVTTRLENMLFLSTAIEIAFLVLLSQPVARSTARLVKVIPWLVALQLCILLFFVARFLLRGHLFPLVVIASLGVSTLIHVWLSRSSTSIQRTRLLYMSCVVLATAAASLLIAQYILDDRLFTLKMGLDLFGSLLIMSMAVIDSLRERMPDEHIWRFRLVLSLSAIFACIILAKSVMWHVSIQKLEQTLRQTYASCTEITPSDFRWLEYSPYTIINNWALPSLALVIQDEPPRKALLAEEDCQGFYQSGMIQLDPWSLFSKEFLIPPLE